MTETAPPMDWLQFVASIIQSIAWPTTVLIIVFLLYKPVLKLLPKLKAVKYGDFEAQFDSGLGKIEEELSQITLRNKKEEVLFARGDSRDSDMRFQLSRSTDLPPYLRIIEAWKGVAAELRRLEDRPQISKTSAVSPFQVARALYAEGLITEPLLKSIDELRQLRNIATHSVASDQISNKQADRYVVNAAEVKALLQSLK